MIRHWSHTRQKGWGYPPKKTACESGLWFQRYKPLKSVTTAGRPLILRFLVYISRNSLRASRSLVTKFMHERGGVPQLDKYRRHIQSGQLGIAICVVSRRAASPPPPTYTLDNPQSASLISAPCSHGHLHLSARTAHALR